MGFYHQQVLHPYFIFRVMILRAGIATILIYNRLASIGNLELAAQTRFFRVTDKFEFPYPVSSLPLLTIDKSMWGHPH